MQPRIKENFQKIPEASYEVVGRIQKAVQCEVAGAKRCEDEVHVWRRAVEGLCERYKWRCEVHVWRAVEGLCEWYKWRCECIR